MAQGKYDNAIAVRKRHITRLQTNPPKEWSRRYIDNTIALLKLNIKYFQQSD